VYTAYVDQLRSLLPQVLRKRGLYHEAEAALIAHQSKRWLKESLPGCHTMLKARSYADAVLTIEAADDASALEAQQASEGLLAYLREECGHDHIKAIRLARTF